MSPYQRLVIHILRVHGGGFLAARKLADMVFEKFNLKSSPNIPG